MEENVTSMLLYMMNLNTFEAEDLRVNVVPGS